MAKSKRPFIRHILSAEVVGHPAVWSVITGIFILLGYIWLQQFAKPYANQLKTETTTKADAEIVGQRQSSKWNPDIYRAIETQDIMGITDSDDDPRALEYRQLIDADKKIAPLLEKAAQRIAENSFAATAKDNAWDIYQQVLRIDANNTSAKLGINQILATLQDQVEEAIIGRQYDDAEKWLAQLDSIQANSVYQATKRTEITEQIQQDLEEKQQLQAKRERQKRLQTALSQARSVFKTKPPQAGAAYDLYQLALELSPGNRQAKKGIKKIKRYYAKKLKLEIAKQDFQAARQALQRLENIDGDAADIKTLTAMLAKEEAKAQAQRVANANKLAQDQSKTKQVIQLESQNEEESALIPALPPAEPASQANNGLAVVETIDVTQPYLGAINPTISAAQSRSNQLQKGIKAYYSGNYDEAFTWLHPLAVEGVAQAQFRIGIMYFQGRTVVTNRDLATQWISKALPTILRAAQGNQAWAQTDLGTAYEQGLALKKDIQRAASWYTKAANSGYAGAQTNLGVLYGMGQGVNYDRQLAVYWLKKAALQGDKIAQDNLDILDAR